jgi:predicted DNA-binding transcriptional regulator AlpA
MEEDRVISFDEWCELNGFSRSTGQRLMKSGEGPQFVRLSLRRIGVTVEENRRWLAARKMASAV